MPAMMKSAPCDSGCDGECEATEKLSQAEDDLSEIKDELAELISNMGTTCKCCVAIAEKLKPIQRRAADAWSKI